MEVPDSLPTTDDGLREFVVAQGQSEIHQPEVFAFFDDEGTWCFAPDDPWPQQLFRKTRLAFWREHADPRYEGLEVEEHARAALEVGKLPGHLADLEAVEELFKDGSGNIYLRLAGVETVDGHSPIFFFDHDMGWFITARARNVYELMARFVLNQFHSSQEARALSEAPLPLSAASLKQYGGEFADGWRAVLGLPSLASAPERRRPTKKVIRGDRLAHLTELSAFKEAYSQRYILARAVDDAALTDVLRCLLWWNVGTFNDLDAALRNAMARLLSAAADEPGNLDKRGKRKFRWENEFLVDAAQILAELLVHGEMTIRASEDPLEIVDHACRITVERLGGLRTGSLEPSTDNGIRKLDDIPEMSAFHARWAGTVPAPILAQGDHMALADVSKHCADLGFLKTFAYNLVRENGDEHLERLDATLDSLLPCDQVLVLHGLDAFPRHPGVLRVYDRVLDEKKYESVVRATARYRERVASGVKPTGWER